MSVQSHIASLQSELNDPDWLDKPNSWLRQLNAVRLNEMAVCLVHKLVGGQRNNSRDIRYKISANGKYIDVKVATLGRINNVRSLGWRLHLSGLYSHLALVAIYPTDARVFLIPIEQIPDTAFRLVKGRKDQYQFVTTQPYELPAWLLGYEIHEAA
jgi:hypothetical protein